MEPNSETLELQATLSAQEFKPKSLIQQPLFIAVAALAIGALVGLGMLYQKHMELQEKHLTQEVTISKTQNELNSLFSKVSSFDSEIAKISDIESRQTTSAKMAYISYMQHDIEGGVVTDDFVVDKVYLIPLDSNKLSVIINVDTQPSMAVHYKGSGSFDLPDRELRAKSQAIIKEVKDRYMSGAIDILPQWDDANVRVTIKNYDVGDTSSGDFLLVGEK